MNTDTIKVAGVTFSIIIFLFVLEALLHDPEYRSMLFTTFLILLVVIPIELYIMRYVYRLYNPEKFN